MSEDFHPQGIFSFDRASDHPPDDSQIPLRQPHSGVYETAGMLSEMLNFGSAPQIPGPGMQFFPQRSNSPLQHEFLNWVDPGGGGGGGGLSLSLSSTLEAAKAEEEMRLSGGSGEMMFFGAQNQQQVMHLQGYGLGWPHPSGHFGFGSILASPASTLGAVNALRSSRFTRPTQELLEEFCSVGRGPLKRNRFSRNDSIGCTTSSAATGSGGPGPSSSNSGKEVMGLSGSDRMEHQRRKVKLVTMLDEVERRYSQYCEQMQLVVNSFDVVMGYGAATPYTALAQKAMSRHFRCLKDAIQVQLKHSCELLGEKDVSVTTGLTKGETPRLKALEQSLRQQRAFHQMGMMDQEAWRPQRGLPERSVNVLRAWLFEHFLHPYPSDADKHLLARQTGLSRNQVSNWFINARVRLWKPMVEEMYQKESKDEEDDDEDDDENEEEDRNDRQQEEENEEEDNYNNKNDENKAQSSKGATTAKISNFNAVDNDLSFFQINDAGVWPPAGSHFVGGGQGRRHGEDEVASPAIISFGGGATATATGDVSLTLGLRHASAAGNPPEKSGFCFREFGS